ncbi:YadA-like family protein, partial [Phocoenobacter skyensis]
VITDFEAKSRERVLGTANEIEVMTSGTTQDNKGFTVSLSQSIKEKLAKVGIGEVAQGNQGSVMGDKVYKAITTAKTILDKAEGETLLTVEKVESTDLTKNSYKLSIDKDKLAQGTHLSYQANNDVAKQVSLQTGLTFKNGENTTATIGENGEVKINVNTQLNLSSQHLGNTLYGSITGLTHNLATVAERSTAISKPIILDEGLRKATTLGDSLNLGWNLQANGTAQDFVQVYDTVNMLNGKGTAVSVENTDGKVSQIKYDVLVDDKTIKVNDQGQLMASIPASTKLMAGTYTILSGEGTAEKPYQVDIAKGNIEASEKGFATGGDVYNAVKEKLTASNIHQIKSTKGDIVVSQQDLVQGDIDLSIANNAITTQKLADKAVTKTKLAEQVITDFEAKSRERVLGTANEIEVMTSGTTQDNKGFTVSLSQSIKEKLAKVGIGEVAQGNQGSVMGDKVYKAITTAKTILDKAEGETLLTVEKVESTDLTKNSYKLSIDKDKLAQGTHLSYQANNDAAKQVSLQTGLTFKNGENTTATIGENGEVKINVNTQLNLSSQHLGNTLYGSITGLTHNLATVAERSTAIAKPIISDDGLRKATTLGDSLNLGWNLQTNGTAQDFVQVYDTVNMLNGKGTAVSVENTDGKVSQIKYDVLVDDRTITVNDSGRLQAVASMPVVDNATIGLTAEGKIVAKTATLRALNNIQRGQAVASDTTGLVTADSVASAINHSGFIIKAAQSVDGLVEGSTEELINPSEMITFEADKNIKLVQKGNIFTFATQDNAYFNQMMLGKGMHTTTLTSTANGLDIGGDRITNIADGINARDAVSRSQLDSVQAIASNKTKLQAGSGTILEGIGSIAEPYKVNIHFGAVEIGDNKAVTGGVVYEAIAGRSDKDFANISDAGKKVITDLVNVEGSNGLSVQSDIDPNTKVKKMTISLDRVTHSALNREESISSTNGNLAIDDTARNSSGGKAFTVTLNKVLSQLDSLILGDNIASDIVSLSKEQGISGGSKPITNVASGLGDKSLTEITEQDSEWHNVATVGDLTQVKSNVNHMNKIIGGEDVNGQPVNAEGVPLTESDGKTPITTAMALKTYDVEGQTATVNNTVVSAINRMNEGGIKYFHTNDHSGQKTGGKLAKTNDSSASGKYATAIGRKASATAENALAFGNGSQATAENAIAIGSGNLVNAKKSGALGDPNYISEKAGQNEEGDEVSGSYAIGNDNVINSSNTFVLGNNVNNSGDKDEANKPIAQGSSVENSVYLGNKTTATKGNQVGTKNLTQTGQKGKTTTAGDKGTVKSVSVGGMAYGDFAGAKANGVVSVGSSGNERRIQNVAAGEISPTSTDAINGSQLHSTYQGLAHLSQKIMNVEVSTRAGIASGAAIATLGQARNSGDNAVSVGFAVHQGQSALAAGVSSWSNNGKWLVKGNAAYDSQRQKTLSGSATYSW